HKKDKHFLKWEFKKKKKICSDRTKDDCCVHAISITYY
ncbi:MAG: hypothetical protein ACI90V_009780, partial [Bacillariaceae sp.]